MNENIFSAVVVTTYKNGLKHFAWPSSGLYWLGQTTCAIFRKGVQAGACLMNLLLWKQSWSGSCQNPLKGHDTYRDPSKFIASSVEEQESPADGIWRLGTRENTDQVHEPFKKSISFNGIRHSVHLPWKVHLPEPPSNYGTCFCCLETQIQRL